MGTCTHTKFYPVGMGKSPTSTVLISWPQQTTGYRLQVRNDLSAGTWSEAGVVNNQYQFTETRSAPARFYRLLSSP